jgi:hypothetical protein
VEISSNDYACDTSLAVFRYLFAPGNRSVPLAFLYLPFPFLPWYSLRVVKNLVSRSPHMEWTTPQHEEVDLSCEISSYANAEL